jgi:two-component system response regulator AtoC
VIEIVAQSERMREVVRLAERVAATDANVLVTGESGAGKDALALFIHQRSKRSSQPFVKIDCAALPRDLLEAELFGYERGAFTGATESRPGRLESAHNGTCLLDEIAHLSIDAQATLLRVIERREFERLGGRRTIKIDARLIALTNVDLDEAVKRRSFREDLFYRLNVVRLRVPALRERLEDIPELAEALLKLYAQKHGRQISRIEAPTLALLREHDFPGNVRELANVIERAVIVATGPRLELGHLPEALRLSVETQRKRRQRQTLAEVEADYIVETLLAAKGNKSDAARMLGISRKNLYERLARLDASVQVALQHGNERTEQIPKGDRHAFSR